MARQVMTGGAAWQGRMKQQTMQAYANEVRTSRRHICWQHGECSINQNAAQCSVQVRPGSQQEKRPWRAHPLKSSTKLGRLRGNQVIHVDASTKGKTIQHEDYRPAKHNGCGWECLPMRSTEHISRWPKAAKRERRRDQDGHREATSGRQYGTGINQHVAREAQRSGWPKRGPSAR